jgi:Ankyrin repeats (3 copies)
MGRNVHLASGAQLNHEWSSKCGHCVRDRQRGVGRHGETPGRTRQSRFDVFVLTTHGKHWYIHQMNDQDAHEGELWLLHDAAQRGDIASVRRLLSAGADINEFDDLGNTPLHYAAAGEHLDTVGLLLQRGADVNARHEPSTGNTPLRDIAATCSLRMAERLLNAGANPTMPGWMQLTALDQARNRRRGDGPAVYRLLLRAAERSA